VKQEKSIYYSGRHLLEALQALDRTLLDLPVVLVHGKELHKPNLVAGFIPAPVEVARKVVESKSPSLLTLASLLDPRQMNGRKVKAKAKAPSAPKAKRKRTRPKKA
jgi:hypothetical protein